MTKKLPQCEYADADGRCEKKAHRHVDSRALGAPDHGLDVCEEHYALVKAWWRDGADAALNAKA